MCKRDVIIFIYNKLDHTKNYYFYYYTIKLTEIDYFPAIVINILN